MNQSLLLHVVERLEGLVGKLPGTIQKPILSELTPLKELFLQQRGPRLLFAGSGELTVTQILDLIFPSATPRESSTTEIYTWKEFALPDHGAIQFFDARGSDDGNIERIEEELRRQSADIIVFVDGGQGSRGPRKIDIENLRTCAALAPNASVIGIAVVR